jgi:hypothetical protein
MLSAKLTNGLNGLGNKEEKLNIKNWSVIKISIILKFMNKEKWNWSLSVGFYPGILFGTRAYEEKDRLTYVFYIPFVDVALELPYK